MEKRRYNCMARLLHLSDLHFGAHDPKLVEAVERRVDEENPDIVIISGDFTQRARTDQFEEAGAFLGRLRDAGHVVLAIPGNHDIPLYDVFRRFLSPLTRYRKYIDDTLCPFHELPGASILGLNTARSATFKDGSISHSQIAFVREVFAKTDPGNVRILVTHHPLFSLPTGDGSIGAPVDHQQDALSAIGEAGIDLLLAGHNHLPSTSANALVHGAGRVLVIQAGTATSTRVRGHGQSFNHVLVDDRHVEVTIETWQVGGFARGDRQCFYRAGEHWELAEGTPATPVADRVAT
ncbi:MAG: metallophosphoesterase [Sphingomicrobium sp.]